MLDFPKDKQTWVKHNALVPSGRGIKIGITSSVFAD
jgi:hypothetical protein